MKRFRITLRTPAYYDAIVVAPDEATARALIEANPWEELGTGPADEARVERNGWVRDEFHFADDETADIVDVEEIDR